MHPLSDLGTIVKNYEALDSSERAMVSSEPYDRAYELLQGRELLKQREFLAKRSPPIKPLANTGKIPRTSHGSDDQVTQASDGANPTESDN